MKICRVATVPFLFTHHLKSQIEDLVSAGHEVHLVSSAFSDFGELLKADLTNKRVSVHSIEIARRISLPADVKALIKLYQYFRANQFDVVHSVTSKAGLLCALAAIAAGIPIRMHTFAGQPWADLLGPVRWIAKASDWIIVRLNTQTYADSASQRDFLISEGIAKKNQIKVLGLGSIAGVDLQRFNLKNFQKIELRKNLGISADAIVIVFIGRLTHEKGIAELVLAFKALIEFKIQDLHLILVGPDEIKAVLPLPVTQYVCECNNIHKIGYDQRPEMYLAMSDIFCLPSYREGFGSVVIEAASMGLPTVATRVIGLVDAVVENETGLLVSKKNVNELTKALHLLIKDPNLRNRLATAAIKRAFECYGSSFINGLVIKEYEDIFVKKVQNLN
jgi:glycosyltransferase involved in cell wall biosynthesis